MMFPKIAKFSGALAAGILFAVSIASPARAQSVLATTLPATATSSDGSLTLALSSSNPSGAVDVNNTYTWTVTNNSSATRNGVILGSHWGDYCINFTVSGCSWAPPQGPTLISAGPGCAGQSSLDTTTALFGIWCTPDTGVTLLPNSSVSGSVTVRPNTGGPVNYTVYTGHNNSTGAFVFDVSLSFSGINAPAATDIQISGAASTGSPSVGSDFTYTYQIKNAGPWGTFGGVTFTDTLPDSLTYVSSSVVEGANSSLGPTTITLTNLCSAVGQTVVCSLNDMTVGGVWNQATVTLTVTAPSTAQPISNTATVHPNTSVNQTDSNTNNNQVTVNVAAK